ncbi:MAG: hypothetical protein WDM92_06905 [Caulobacteraceae bacterium]
MAVVALAFAVYALARDWLGPAGAAAVVAGIAALGLLLTGLFFAFAATRQKREPGIGEKIGSFAKERPLAALAAGLAAAFFAVRNPQILMALLLAFLEPKSGRKS